MRKIKHFKNVMSLLLLLALAGGLLAGCAGGGASSASLGGQSATPTATGGGGEKGGYVETKLALGAGEESFAIKLARRADGSILATGLDRESEAPVSAWESRDNGDSWQELDNSGVTAVKDLVGNLYASYAGTVAPDGTWWVVYTPMFMPDGMDSEYVTATTPSPGEEGDEEEPKESNAPETITLYRVAPGGQPEVVDVPLFEEMANRSDVFLSAMTMLQSEEGYIVVSMHEQAQYLDRYLLILDSEGKQVQSIVVNSQGADRLAVKGGYLYMLDNEGVLKTYELATGKPAESYGTPMRLGHTSNTAYAIEDDGSLCYMDGRGVHRVAKGGSLVQNLVEGSGYAFSQLRFGAADICPLPGGSYITIASNDYGTELFRYDYDPDYVRNTQDAIRLWALKETHALRAAVAVFSRENPDIPLLVEYGRGAEDTGATDEDIIRTLNTRLVAGEDVPDVLVLDGLPVDSYVAAGMLTDLTGKINTEGTYENIMQAYVRDGKAYGYPTLFAMPTFWARAEDDMQGKAETLEDLAALAQTPDNLVYGGWQSMFDAYYAAYSPVIFPAGGGVDEEALRSFLECTAQISTALGLTGTEDYSHGGVMTDGVMPVQGISAYTEGMYGGPTKYAADIMNTIEGTWQQFIVGGEQYIQAMPGGGFIPLLGLGVPSGAAGAENADKFIQSSLNESDVQFPNMEQGFAVRKSVNDEYWARDYSQYEAMFGEPVKALPQDYDWDSLIASYQAPMVDDAILKNKLFEQAKALYSGSTALDAAVSSVLQNTQIYFAERAA